MNNLQIRAEWQKWSDIIDKLIAPQTLTTLRTMDPFRTWKVVEGWVCQPAEDAYPITQIVVIPPYVGAMEHEKMDGFQTINGDGLQNCLNKATAAFSADIDAVLTVAVGGDLSDEAELRKFRSTIYDKTDPKSLKLKERIDELLETEASESELEEEWRTITTE